jgi:hypothetical protein
LAPVQSPIFLPSKEKKKKKKAWKKICRMKRPDTNNGHFITQPVGKKNKKKEGLAGCQWLTPVILTTREAEIRRIVVQSQPWANSS